MRLVSI